MPELSKKLEYFEESIIRKMTRLANKYEAINLSQGFPDFDPPKEIIHALEDATLNGPHQYEITWGSKQFREHLAQKQSRFMDLNIDADENVVVTCGSTEAMLASLLTIIDPGDKVIIFSPFYENYGADTILSNATPIYVPLIPPTFHFDKEQLEAAFKEGAKALILCNPSNPCGKVFTKEELNYIAKLAIQYDAFVITDEVYEHLVYEPYIHTYIASLPNMWERTLSCSSLSKTYSITGWRLGYIIGPKFIINECKKVHDFLTVGAAAPLQKAAVTGLAFHDEYYRELQRIYTEKKNFFLKGLDEIGLDYYEPQGAYYVLVDISKFNHFASDNEFAQWLIKEIGVAGVPGSSFFKEDVNQYIRFHFAKKKETLKIALTRLSKLKQYQLKGEN